MIISVAFCIHRIHNNVPYPTIGYDRFKITFKLNRINTMNEIYRYQEKYISACMRMVVIPEVLHAKAQIQIFF